MNLQNNYDYMYDKRKKMYTYGYVWHTRRSRVVPLVLLTHFNVFCDLLLHRITATRYLFAFYDVTLFK